MFSTLILRPALSLSICVLNVASAYTEYEKWEKQQKRREAFRKVRKNVATDYLVRWYANGGEWTMHGSRT